MDEIKDQVGEAVYNDITTLKRFEGPTVGNELHGKKLSIRSHNAEDTFVRRGKSFNFCIKRMERML